MASPTAIRRDTLTFEEGVCYELVLKYGTGKPISNGNVMFTTTMDQVFFLRPEAAQKIHALGLATNEPFEILKRNGVIIVRRVNIEQQAEPLPTKVKATPAATAQEPSAEPEQRDDTSLSGLMASAYLASINALVIAEQYAIKKGVNFKITSGEVRSAAHCIFIAASRNATWQR
jgi:hypothetical protein